MNVLGAVQRTSQKTNTRDPMFYETFDFKVEIIHGFGLQLAPRQGQAASPFHVQAQ